jgi:hypothetical protein
MSQGLISMSGSFWVSTVIASILLGFHLYDADEFRKRFKVSAWLVSLIGSMFWFGALLIEIGPE